MSSPDLDTLRLDAKRLQRACERGEPWALERLRHHPPRADLSALKRADFLQLIAREYGFESWPRLKLAAETADLDRAGRVQRLKEALFRGQTGLVERLLEDTPDLAQGLFGLQCALYDREPVLAALAADPGRATRPAGPLTPLLHLSQSRWIRAHPGREADMLALAARLLALGADPNGRMTDPEGTLLSPLYGAVARAGSLPLVALLLRHGADPNDGESLYHATECGDPAMLRLLLEHGASPRGTNALLRALDMQDPTMVELLLAHGAEPDEGPLPALHHAARRDCSEALAGRLLATGADPRREWRGATPVACAAVFGARGVSAALAAQGLTAPLSPEEALLAGAAEGRAAPGRYLDPAQLAPAYADLLHDLAALPGRLYHLRALLALGVPADRPNAQGLPPIQIAGWNGRADTLAELLRHKPDLGQVNGFGGTLLSTILHGADNAPRDTGRDHLACLHAVLHHGVALPRRAVAQAGREDVAGFLRDWAERHPGQVV